VKTIVLVNPPYSFWSPEKNYLRPFIGTLPSLGLLSLAAVLREYTLRETLSLILRCPFDELNLSFLTPYPGTEIYAQAKRSAGFTEDWSRMNALNCIFKPEALSVEALEKAYARMIRQFYMRPRITFSYLGLLARSPDNCARLAAGFSRWLLTR